MLKILLVEDDIQLARNLEDFLQTEGYSVTHKEGQTSGLDAFSQTSYDCVLLDLSLKDGSGFAVCSAIRAISDVPVIILTASADEACTVAGFELGADDFISKPFRPRELAARIKNALRHHAKAPTLLKCGSVTLDPARGMASKNGADLYLSPIEYRLLLVFLSNKGRLLTRDRLAEELWSVSGEFVSDNTLNVYIKRLREKIEDDPSQPAVILTVRGMGYKAAEI
ncbi:MAG: response regulator transcription factor [Ruminococcus sp.]|nr:response regulator transcription factor [Ruminococcus sp.]MBQ3915329.1 response regulator transcription factor [Ruminococcus sp.]